MILQIRKFAYSKSIFIYTLLTTGLILFLRILGMGLSPDEIQYFNFQDSFFVLATDSPTLSLVIQWGIMILASSLYYKALGLLPIWGTKFSLPFLIFNIFYCTQVGMKFLSISTLVTVVFILITLIMTQAFHIRRAVEASFIMSVMLSSLSFIWYPALYYIYIVLIGMIMMRILNFKTILSFAVGYFLPRWLAYAYLFGTGQTIDSKFGFDQLWHFKPDIMHIFELQSLTTIELSKMLCIAFIIPLGIFTTFFTYGNITKEKAKAKTVLYFFIILSLYSSVLIIIDSKYWLEHLAILNITQTVLLSHYVARSKNNRIIYILSTIIATFVGILGYTIWIN